MPGTTATVNVYFYRVNISPNTVQFVFMFNPLIVTLGAATSGTTYSVTFTLAGTNLSGVTFTRATFPNKPPNLSTSGENSTSMTLNFTNTGLTSQVSLYDTILVNYNNATYSSGDPEIVLPPPTPYDPPA
ncbi:MAG: hypothetical protein ACLGH0_09695 [Thermoanaerobaculia bacterium]